MPPARSPRATAAALLLSAAASALAIATAPVASATDGSVFTFPRLGTVVVDGTVDSDVNFTVYRILDPTCTGTDFPGPDNSCVPQEATDTLVIPAGTYHGRHFRLAQVPDCGPTQQDVYEGQYQPTVTATGTRNYLAGGILQLGTCTGPSSTPSSSAPPSSPSSTDTPSRTITTPPASTTAPPSTPSTPFSSGALGTEGTAYDYSAAPANRGSQLAATGTDHTTALIVIGAGAVVAGAGALSLGRRVSRTH